VRAVEAQDVRDLEVLEKVGEEDGTEDPPVADIPPLGAMRQSGVGWVEEDQFSRDDDGDLAVLWPVCPTVSDSSI
jgi:hypothetical protein